MFTDSKVLTLANAIMDNAIILWSRIVVDLVVALHQYTLPIIVAWEVLAFGNKLGLGLFLTK